MNVLLRPSFHKELVGVIECEKEAKTSWTKLFDHFDEAFDINKDYKEQKGMLWVICQTSVEPPLRTWDTLYGIIRN